MKFAAIISFVISLSQVAAACAQQVPLPPKVAKAAFSTPHPYPFWATDSLPSDVVNGVRPLADGAAFPVAPGYFLVSMYSMGTVALDMGADPHVFVGDGTKLYPGEFVAVNLEFRLGLVRADFQPPAYKLAPDTFGASLVGLAERKGSRGVYEQRLFIADSCMEAPVSNEEGQQVYSIIGCHVQGDTLLGVAYINKHSQLVALLATTGRGAAQDGLDSSIIRRFLDTYFSSWGREVQPKPSY